MKNETIWKSYLEAGGIAIQKHTSNTSHSCIMKKHPNEPDIRSEPRSSLVPICVYAESRIYGLPLFPAANCILQLCYPCCLLMPPFMDLLSANAPYRAAFLRPLLCQTEQLHLCVAGKESNLEGSNPACVLSEQYWCTCIHVFFFPQHSPQMYCYVSKFCFGTSKGIQSLISNISSAISIEHLPTFKQMICQTAHHEPT